MLLHSHVACVSKPSQNKNPKAADERTHRHGKQVYRGIRRDDKLGKPMETMRVDDVDSTKLIKTSEVENSNSTHRNGQRRDTSSVGSDNFETKFKDHEPEDTKAFVPLSAGIHLAAQHSDAGSSIDWVEELCQGRCAGSSEEHVLTWPKTSLSRHRLARAGGENHVLQHCRASATTTPSISRRRVSEKSVIRNSLLSQIWSNIFMSAALATWSRRRGEMLKESLWT